MTYTFDTSDGQSYTTTLQTLPDMVHRIEAHMVAGAFRSACLVGTRDDTGEHLELFHIVAGFWKVRRFTHADYCRHHQAWHRRALRAIRARIVVSTRARA